MILACAETLATQTEITSSNPSECAKHKNPAFKAGFFVDVVRRCENLPFASHPLEITWIQTQYGAAPRV